MIIIPSNVNTGICTVFDLNNLINVLQESLLFPAQHNIKIIIYRITSNTYKLLLVTAHKIIVITKPINDNTATVVKLCFLSLSHKNIIAMINNTMSIYTFLLYSSSSRSISSPSSSIGIMPDSSIVLIASSLLTV